MEVIEGSSKLPVIYSAHHASHNFGEFAHRVALTNEQQIRFSDYGTDSTIARNGLMALVGERSRALGDLNRNPDDPGRFQSQDYGKPERHDIWLPGQELTEEEKRFCQEQFYTPYHNTIIETLAKRDSATFVVAWDNTAHYEIGKNEAGEIIVMPPFILSNRGQEEGAQPRDDEPVSCDPAFMELLAESFSEELKLRKLPHQVHLNLVYKGGYIARRYSSLRNKAELEAYDVTTPVQSLQVEYDTAITHDQKTLEFMPDRASAMQEAFEVAIEEAFAIYQELLV